MNANSNDAIMPAFLVWGFWLATSAVARGARRRARRLDEVRRAAARAALAHLPERAPSAAARCGSRSAFVARVAGGVLDPAARAEPRRGGAHLRRPDARLPARPRLARSRPGIGGSTTRAGSLTSTLVQVILQVARPRARRRRRGDPAAQGPARARRAERRRARRLRARRSPTGRTSTSRGSCPSSCSRCCCRGGSPAGREPALEPGPRGAVRGAAGAAVTTRTAFLALIAAVAALAVGLFVAELEGDAGHQRHARLPRLRRADRERRRAVPRLQRSSIRRRPGPVRRAGARHARRRTATTRPSRR